MSHHQSRLPTRRSHSRCLDQDWSARPKRRLNVLPAADGCTNGGSTRKPRRAWHDCSARLRVGIVGPVRDSAVQILNKRYALVPNEAPRKGGMAEVCRAIDMLEDQKSVAIKLFKSDLDGDRFHLEAYARESAALQRLDHPNIIKIIDGGRDEESGRRYFVLEWLERSLAEHVAKTPCAGWDSFFDEVGRPILGALSYAYNRGVIHRDLKPQNVLYSADGQIKVADFGISKLTAMIAPGLTVAGFRSQPYSPPEPDDGLYTETRDVFGFAVLALACLGHGPLVTYEDVYKAAENFDGPPDIAAVLERALSQEPANRQSNIIVLRNELEQIQGHREDHFVAASDARKCYVKISRNVEERMRSYRGRGEPSSEIKDAIVADLNEICGVKRDAKSAKEEAEVHLVLYAGQHMYRAVVDPSTKAFIIIESVSPGRPSWLELQRESAWTPKVRFTYLLAQPPGDGVGTISWLLDGVIEAEERYREQLRSEQADKLFRIWGAVLHAKSDIERRRSAPIKYDGCEVLGSRIRLRTNEPLDDELIGQPRLIEYAQHRFLACEVESIEGKQIVLWTDEDIPQGLPNRGRLQFDTRAERQAINRQRQALDAVRFRRSARQDLRDLLVEPEIARPPVDPGDVKFVADRFDESKQQAVRKALGTESFLVVEGPPGTGKTRFITELVLQTLQREPRSRILLTSQTHVALDHALEQLRRADTKLKLVRIGHRNDERISREITDLLLENRVDTWLKSIQGRSEKFLTKFAADLGVNSSEINLGIAAERLRVALEGLGSLESQRNEMETVVRRLSEQDAQRAAVERGDTYHEVQEALRETSDTAARLAVEIRRAEERVRSARQSLGKLPDLGSELSGLSAHELREWEQAFLDRNDSTRRMHRLIRLAEEWYLRFGQSRDFFGALIADSEVIAGTCLGFAGIRGIANLEFDLCIVDEASKAAVTELLVALTRSRRWVLVGDRNQLPPFVEDALEDPTIQEEHGLRTEDLKTTLLELLADRLPNECVTKLLHQHRMVRQIGDLVSHCFYNGELKSLREGEARFLDPALPRPVTWFSTTLLPDRWELRDHESYKNIAEVLQIRRVLKRINLMAGAKKIRLSVAVLTGYAAQKEEVLRALDADHESLQWLTIECNTVDAFQGREADVAIYSVTRCNQRGDIGFLRERRRLNVALSRARSGLVIIGDASFIRGARGYNPWTSVLDYIEAHPSDCVIQEVRE